MVILLFTFQSVIAQPGGDDRNPKNEGKCVNAGTIKIIDGENNLLTVDTLNYGRIILKVTPSTEIKIENNFLNFEDLRIDDNIGFQGFWSGNQVSAVNIDVLEGNPTTYYALKNDVIAKTKQGGQAGYTTSATLSRLIIEKIIIKKGIQVNLRVRLYNTGYNPVEEYFSIILYIRKSPGDNYEQVKFWEEKGIKGKNYLSRDYFIKDPSPYIFMNYFQVKAELIDKQGNIFYTFEQDYPGQDVL